MTSLARITRSLKDPDASFARLPLLLLDPKGDVAATMQKRLGPLVDVWWLQTAGELIGLVSDGVVGRVHVHGDPPDADAETTVRRVRGLLPAEVPVTRSGPIVRRSLRAV